MAIEAQFHTTCRVCLDAISPGDAITGVELMSGVDAPSKVTAYVHPGCADVAPTDVTVELTTDHPVMPRGTTAADRCPHCFLIHSPGQLPGPVGCE